MPCPDKLAEPVMNILNNDFVTSDNMAERITIMLDGGIAEKLRDIQAKKIKESQSSISFSRVLNDALEEGLEKIERHPGQKSLSPSSFFIKKRNKGIQCQDQLHI